jgi:hypothetical protein
MDASFPRERLATGPRARRQRPLSCPSFGDLAGVVSLLDRNIQETGARTQQRTPMLREIGFALQKLRPSTFRASSSTELDEDLLKLIFNYSRHPDRYLRDLEVLREDPVGTLRKMHFEGDKDQVRPEESTLFRRGAQAVRVGRDGKLTAVLSASNNQGNKFRQTVKVFPDGFTTNVTRDLGGKRTLT